LVFNALNRVVSLYNKDKKITEYFKHLKLYEPFLSLPVLSDPIIPIARYDLVRAKDGRFQINEPNTCCPGGPIWTSLFYNILKETYIYHFVSSLISEVLTPLQNPSCIYNFLRNEYEKYFPKASPLNILITDTKSAPMETELFELRDGARRLGYKSEKAIIQDLKYDNGIVSLNGEKVHIIYQFLDVLFTNEMAQIGNNFDEIKDYMAALRGKACLVINPFPPIFISEDKIILALLCDPLFKDYFTKDEHRAIKELVPETYRVRDENIIFEGEKINLLQLLKSRKKDFVIKAQMESMGRDILIGLTATKDEWEDKICKSVDGMYVAQRFIEEEPLQIPDPNDPDILKDMNYTLALFFMGGEPQGMFNRVSTGLVTNVAQRGAMQNVIIYDDNV
jgi:hypothetical protein